MMLTLYCFFVPRIVLETKQAAEHYLQAQHLALVRGVMRQDLGPTFG